MSFHVNVNPCFRPGVFTLSWCRIPESGCWCWFRRIGWICIGHIVKGFPTVLIALTPEEVMLYVCAEDLERKIYIQVAEYVVTVLLLGDFLIDRIV